MRMIPKRSPSPCRPLPAALLATALAAPLLLPASALATSIGPQPGSTGIPERGELPAEMVCTACHSDATLNPDELGRISLEGLPESWQPGASYELTFRIEHPDPRFLRWGFQLTAVGADDLLASGSLVATDPVTTQVVEGGPGGRSYVEHAYGGTAIGTSGGASWTFRWVAPEDAGAGTVAFFAAANASNVDGANTGDYIYSRSPATVSSSGNLPAED